MPIVPIATTVKRAKKSGIFKGKNTKNNSIMNSSRHNITRRLARNLPKYIVETDIGANNKASRVPCSISLLYVGDRENIPAKKNDIHRIGDASCDIEKSIKEKANLKEASIINDNMR